VQVRDWLTIGALILGPIFAVCITLYIEQRRERQRARRWALLALVSNRHSVFADERLKALNSIDLLFQDAPEVRSKWKAYLGQLSNEEALKTDLGAREAQRLNLELISAMARSLGYKSLSQTDIDRGYFPKHFNIQAAEAKTLQDSFLEFLQGALKLLQANQPPQAALPQAPAADPKKDEIG